MKRNSIISCIYFFIDRVPPRSTTPADLLRARDIWLHEEIYREIILYQCYHNARYSYQLIFPHLTMGNRISREDITSPPPKEPLPITPSLPTKPKPGAEDQEACPVDHKTREAWLAQARQKDAAPQIKLNSSKSTPPVPSIPNGESCDSKSIAQSAPPPSAILSELGLDQRREISTIPRAAAPTDIEADKKPANNEIESGKDKSGKWIYPSEQMFFEAMRRKHYDPKAEDMRSIVPIHNAVNERAWGEILEWEKGQGSES